MRTPLYDARRARAWTQTELAQRLRSTAQRRDLPVATQSSLRVLISGWENGNVAQVDARYQVLLQDVFGLPAAALGLNSPVEADRATDAMPGLVRHNASRQEISADLLAYYGRQLEDHARMDNMFGPSLVVSVVDLQLRQLDELTGRGPMEVARLASRYAEFSGWLLQDAGHPAEALAHTDRAVDLADGVGDQHLTAYNLMRKSNVLIGLRERQRAQAVARRAVALAEQAAPDLLPVCLRQQALVDAQLRNERDARVALERALTLSSPLVVEGSLVSYCTTAYVQMEAALCLLTLRRPTEAADICTEALSQWPAELVRDESLCLARLAVARSDLREVEGACEAGIAAVARIQAAPSARAIHMIRVTAHKLKPFERTRAVNELTQALAEVA